MPVRPALASTTRYRCCPTGQDRPLMPRVLSTDSFGGSKVREAIPLGRIAGFEVKVHWSVIVILWLFTWSLATTLPGRVAGYSRPVYWLAGACGALVLSASLLAHELAHAVVARRM